LVEDAAESLGSYYKDQHTGSFGLMGVMSFNGNKIITAGGGGCIVTNDKELAKKAKHLTTTAKIPHKWDYGHDQIGYNYRMPNLNAALLLAQLENLDSFIINKKLLANKYKKFFHNNNIEFFIELKDSKPNYWLNSILLKNRKQRDIFLEETNSSEIMTRPLWLLMNSLKMFKDDQRDNLDNSRWLSDRVVNLPSSPIIHS